MTETKHIEAERKLILSIKTVFLTVTVLTLIVLYLYDAETVSLSVHNSLTLCFTSIIPSVYPCMVLSGLLVILGGGDLFGRLFGNVSVKVFKLSAPAASAVILGAVCGFPIGAATATALYKQGRISRYELERMIGFVSLPSPAFVINAVGVSMLKNKHCGIVLYFVLLSVSVMTGIVSGVLGKKHDYCLSNRAQNKSLTISDAVTVISDSTVSVLKICGYVVMFSSLASVISSLLRLPPLVCAVLNGILEFSSGCSQASLLNNGASFALCGAFLGWCGFGVHFQVMSFVGKDISYKKYYLFSAIRAVACFLVCLFINTLFLDI